MTERTVVVLSDYCNMNGGASRIAIDEAISLADAGQRVIFFGATGPVCSELQNAPLEIICLDQPVPLENNITPGILLQGMWNTAAYTRMDKLLQTLDPATTIVHLHGYTKTITTSPVRPAVKRGFKVLCTLHDFFAACPNGAFFDYVKSAPCPKRGLSLNCITTNCDKRHYTHKLYRVARSAVQKNFGMLPDGVMDYITLSNRSAEILKSYLPEGARYYPLENLIEVPKAPPVDAAANTNIVAVGRLDIEKGIETLLEAARIAGVKLSLVGDGPLRPEAEAQGARVTGWVKPEAVLAELENARCLIFPSLWYEAYGLVVTEAAARGIPAIVSDITAPAERVTDGIHGWQFRTGDAGDLARVLTNIKDDEKIRTTGRNAYDRFWSNPPTRENHTAGLLTIYNKMLQPR